MRHIDKCRPDESGGYFNVWFYNGYVVKRMKQMHYMSLFEQIRIWNIIADDVEHLVPVEYWNEHCVTMEIPPGVLLRTLGSNPFLREHYGLSIQELRAKVQEHGYTITDLSYKNLYYDFEQNFIYVVDFSSLKPLNKKIKKKRRGKL